MHRCTLFTVALLALAMAGPVLATGQDPASNPTKSTDPQAKPDSQSQPDSKTQPDSTAKPADSSNVLILKSPQMPVQPQFTPELRAVDLEKRKEVDNATKRHLIQLMDAEFAHVRNYIPPVVKALVIDPQGRVTPADVNLFQQIQARGAAAKVGDKVQITNVVFHEKSIYFELNGGPKKKTTGDHHNSGGEGRSGQGTKPHNG